MEKRLVLYFIAICLLFNGCVVVAESPVLVKTEQPEFNATDTVQVQVKTNTPTIPLETSTPTLVPLSTETPLPTIDKHPPTPTVERPVEWDIDPYIEYEVEGEYKGVKIKASVIIDRSLEPLVKGIYVNTDLLSESIAKSLAYVWYSRRFSYSRELYHRFRYDLFTPEEMDRFLGLWAKAQETGSEYYWRQVQINNIWANDMNDGDGYVQQPYNLWPMYEGPTPYGVTAIDKITIALIDVPKSKISNVTPLISPCVNMGPVQATNLDEKNLIYYDGTDYSKAIQDLGQDNLYSPKRATKQILKASLFALIEWLVYNDSTIDFSKEEVCLGVSEEMAEIMRRAIDYGLK